MNRKELIGLGVALLLAIAVFGGAALHDHYIGAPRRAYLLAFIKRIDAVASNLEDLAKNSTPPPVTDQPYIVEPHVVWQLGLKGNNEFDTGSSGAFSGIGGGDDPTFKNAAPEWSARSLVFIRENSVFESDQVPTREIRTYVAWVIDLNTGKSTAWFLGRPHRMFVDEQGRSLPADKPSGEDELETWFRSIEHRNIAK